MFDIPCLKKTVELQNLEKICFLFEFVPSKSESEAKKEKVKSLLKKKGTLSSVCSWAFKWSIWLKLMQSNTALLQ